MSNVKTKPLIFVSNDDGYDFPGIKTLIKVAMEFGDVIVVVPMQHQSGKGSSISTFDPLRAFKIEQREGLEVYSVSGTPADCAKLGLGVLVGDRKVDLLLSGINHGLNHGSSVLYSGTMGIVFEGVLEGIPSVAFSYDEYRKDVDLSPCEPIMRHVIDRVLLKGLPKGVCLNVNMPKTEGAIKGVKTTITSPGTWTNTWDHRVDVHGLDYYWMLGSYEEENPDDDRTELYWLRRGYASATPVHVDQTDYDCLSQIDEIIS